MSARFIAMPDDDCPGFHVADAVRRTVVVPDLRTEAAAERVAAQLNATVAEELAEVTIELDRLRWIAQSLSNERELFGRVDPPRFEAWLRRRGWWMYKAGAVTVEWEWPSGGELLTPRGPTRPTYWAEARDAVQAVSRAERLSIPRVLEHALPLRGPWSDRG